MNSFLIPKLPVYWRTQKMPIPHSEIAERFDLELTYNQQLGLVCQVSNADLDSMLQKIYGAEYNVGYLQEANTLARPYFTDFFQFVSKFVSSERIRNALEIGCGGCMILEGLARDFGIEVVGVDPSPIAAAEGRKKSLKVIQDFFPSQMISESFDLIFHADVLEHLSDPVAFLKMHRENLNENGHVIISVPDCTESIAHGDVSMVIHQHLNYFDEHSLARVISSAGFKVKSIERASYGGSMYALAQKSVMTSDKPLMGSADKFTNFNRKAKANLSRLENLLFKSESEQRSVGFYVPLRSFPYLSVLNRLDKNYRIFDDTNTWHEQFFDGYSVPVENISDFLLDPTDDVVVMSSVFGDVISKKIKDNARSPVQVFKMTDFWG